MIDCMIEMTGAYDVRQRVRNDRQVRVTGIEIDCI